MYRIYGERELTASEMAHLANELADAGYLVGVGRNYLQFYHEVTSDVVFGKDAGTAGRAEGNKAHSGHE